MGELNVPGIGPVQIQSDTPTQDEAQRILAAMKKINQPPQPDETVIQGRKRPFVVRTPAGQLKIPLAEDGPIGKDFSLGRAVTKGLLDLTSGVITFPLDVVGADHLADTIRKNIPEIETGSPLEDITSVVTQFGIPGGAATKLTKLARVKPGGVKNALKRFGLNVAAATSADIIAANPNDVQTIGNLFPELLPTGIDPDDPAILKRIKLGIEAGTITAGALSALGGVLLTWQGISKIIRPLVKTDEVAREAAAKAMREVVLDPDNAIENIDRIIQEAQGTPFQPTTGTASGDPGLVALERTLVTGGDSSPAFIGRQAENQSALTQQLSQATRRTTGEAEAPGKFFEEGQLQARMVKTQAIESTETQIQAARNEIDNISDELDQFRSMETGASREIDEAVMGELERLTLQKNRLFNDIDAARTVLIDPKDLRAVVKDITTKRGPLDSTPSKLPGGLIGRLKKATAKPKKGEDGKIKEPKPLFFRDLQDLRPDLSAAIKKARADNEGGVVERLLDLRAAIDDEAVKLAGRGNAEAFRAREALDFFKDVFAPRFREGIGRSVAIATKRGTPIPPSAVGSKFVKKTSGGFEAGEDLARIIEGIPDPSQAREAVRQFALSKLAQAAVDPSGKFNSQRIAKFLDDHEAPLASFPGIRKEIEQVSGRSATATKKLNQLEQELADARGALKLTEREQNKSVTALFIGTEPEKAIGRVMGSNDPASTMKQLVLDARKDSSGQATKGLRVAVDKWVDGKVRSKSTNLLGDDFIIVGNEVEDLFKNPRTRGALAEIYTKSDIEILQRVRDQMRLMNRINTQVTAGSATANLQQNAKRVQVVLASMYGIVRGRGIMAISGWVMKALGKDPAVNARAVLKAANLDPELGRLLLTADTPATRFRLEHRLSTYVSNNIAGELSTEDKPRRQRGKTSVNQANVDAALEDLRLSP